MKKTLILLLSLMGIALPASSAKTLLAVGTIAPDFTLLTQTGDSVRLADFRGKRPVVLIFYPGDETPGCTQQLCSIRDDFLAFKRKNAAVFGVNPGSADSHVSFVTKHGFPFPLLVDQGKKVAKRYGCDALVMIQRTVYVIGLDGKIVYAKRGNPSTQEITQAIPVAADTPKAQ